ncbi:MAG: tripartite tricarboxylate transporter substrate binding protein [Betaproteobacteria bacterium]|nr:tripartite tricarboxylate transporter substrate binding protein [Betaproteobacteria bacterium]MBI2508920.1 tripartite tricarboxylate transporter substrate binding protein [Betaproteobacteria bacterium]
MKLVLGIISLAAALTGPPAPATAQDYPARPIRMVVPFSPGGGSDISARILADGLGEALGQTIVVDNRPGAGSILGTDIVAKSTPDGYTTLLGNISMAFNTALYKKLPYDVMRDFSPVTLVTDQPNILVAHPSLPAKSFKEFLALAAAQPGKLTYGSAGIGSGTHLAMEMLLMSRKLDLVHVPYKGTGPTLTALLGNQISVFFSTFASALPHVKSGRLRAFAVTSAKRTRTLPEAPTVAESGFPGYEYSTWYGLLVPAKTPRVIIEKLNRNAVAVLKSEKTRQRYLSQGVEPIPSTSAQYVAHLRERSRSGRRSCARRRFRSNDG